MSTLSGYKLISAHIWIDGAPDNGISIRATHDGDISMEWSAAISEWADYNYVQSALTVKLNLNSAINSVAKLVRDVAPAYADHDRLLYVPIVGSETNEVETIKISFISGPDDYEF